MRPGSTTSAAAFDQPDVVFAVTGRYYQPAPGGPAANEHVDRRGLQVDRRGPDVDEAPRRGLPPLGGNAGRVRRLAVAARTNAQRVFLAGVGRLMRSDDGGATWRAITDDARPGAERVFVSPGNPDLVYGANVTLYRSLDGGATWNAFKGAPGGDDPHVMWIDPTDPNRILLAGDQGASVSVDGGNTWGSWYNQSTAQIYHIGDRSLVARTGSTDSSRTAARWRCGTAATSATSDRSIGIRRPAGNPATSSPTR